MVQSAEFEPVLDYVVPQNPAVNLFRYTAMLMATQAAMMLFFVIDFWRQGGHIDMFRDRGRLDLADYFYDWLMAGGASELFLALAISNLLYVMLRGITLAIRTKRAAFPARMTGLAMIPLITQMFLLTVQMQSARE